MCLTPHLEGERAQRNAMKFKMKNKRRDGLQRDFKKNGNKHQINMQEASLTTRINLGSKDC